MRRVLQIAARKPETSASAAQTAAAVPSSGLASVDNSQGASVATTQLSAELGTIFDQFDLAGDLKGPLKQLVHDLDDEASTYDNSRISGGGAYTQWQCSHENAQVVSAAWRCAHGAYNLDADIDSTMHCRFQRDHVVKPSLKGTIKALTSTIVTPMTASNGNGPSPVLVIAIRGSASKMDQIVNANDGPRQADHFVDPQLSSSNSGLLAHAGFLNSAEALSGAVLEITRKYSRSRGHEKSHILFTGHSAGGAVASLLFVHHISDPDLGPNSTFSCITFGAPPSITGPIDLPKIQSPSRITLALDIINEFDLVGRADRPYVLSLVNLLRSKHGQTPLEPKPAGERTNNSLSEQSPAYTESVSESKGPSESKTWPVPSLFYHHAGLPVVFLVRLDEKNQVQLRAVEVPSHKLELLLFGRLSVHRRSCYAERVQLLEQGHFNGRDGWQDGC